MFTMIQSRVPFKNCTWLYFKAELYLKTPRTPNAKYPKEAENFCTENDNCDVARITHHKSFLSISCFRISSLPFFLSNKNQPTIHHFDGAHAVPRKARNLRIPLFIPSKLFGYIWGKKVVLWHLHTKNSGKVLGNLDHSNGP